jgi:hypothetical protein
MRGVDAQDAEGRVDPLASLETGDVVFISDVAAVSDAPEDWTPAGIVLRPADLGLRDLTAPIVLTSTGRLGEFGPTLRALNRSHLRVVARPGSVDEEQLNAVRDTLPVIEGLDVNGTGASLAGDFLATAPTEMPRSDSTFESVLDVLGRVSFAKEMTRRCVMHGNPMPCFACT